MSLVISHQRNCFDRNIGTRNDFFIDIGQHHFRFLQRILEREQDEAGVIHKFIILDEEMPVADHRVGAGTNGERVELECFCFELHIQMKRIAVRLFKKLRRNCFCQRF
ncbi:MAG TPA: hypothetical protein VL651_03885, partial [Bacteroidia bacterium]|nr:hypothetical protein [Bacteroidia bacterium]